MEGIGARLTDRYESSSRRVSVLCAVTIREERELANRVRIGKVCRTVIECGYQDSAVKFDFTAVDAASVHAECRTAALVYNCDGQGGIPYSGHEGDELQRIARIERQLCNLRGINLGAD